MSAAAMNPATRRPKQVARERRRFLAAGLTAITACVVAFALNAVLGDVHPASVWGLTYGILAAALLVLAALYGVRRRAMKTGTRLAGRTRSWLWIHVWAGGLFLLLVTMHSGLSWPTGTLTWWLFGLSWWTVLSGFLGLFLQSWIPSVLSSGLSLEVNYDRIPVLVDEVRAKAEAIVAEADSAISELYRKSLAPELAAPRRRLVYFTDITGGIRTRLTEVDYLRRFLPADEKEKLTELEKLFRAKLEMDAHYTLQRALRLWLYLHVPTSLVLLGLVVLHVWTVLYY